MRHLWPGWILSLLLVGCTATERLPTSPLEPPMPRPPDPDLPVEPPETLGTFAFTASFAHLELPDGTERRFHVHDALPGFRVAWPFAADFDGDGRDAVGVLDAAGVLRFGTDNASGPFPETRQLAADRQPVVGDWDGDGIDGLGLLDPATGQLERWPNLPSGPPADVLSMPPGWFVVAGDLDGDGRDGVVAFNAATGEARIHDPIEAPPYPINTGLSGYPLLADLDGDGHDALGVYRLGPELVWVDDTGQATGARPLGTDTLFQWPLAGRWSLDGLLDEPPGYPYPSGPATGFDEARLAQGVNAAGALGLTNALLVLHEEALVVEAYWRGWDATRSGNIKSVSKSVLSALMGIATAQGVLSPEDAVSAHLPTPPDDRSAISLASFMTMSTGLEWTEATSLGAMIEAPDWVAYVLEQPLVEPVDSAFRYSTGNTHVGAAVLEAATGQPLAQWAQKTLFEPSGIAFTRWDVDPLGRAIGGAEVWMRPRDLVRFGERYLQPDDPTWVDATFTSYSSGFYGQGYGYWWRRWVLAGREAWAAVGYGGQLVVVVPDAQLVVVAMSEWSVDATTGDAQIGALYDILDQYLVAAVL
ncbi:MAG: serine hydrolase [Myxococcota bacterium]